MKKITLTFILLISMMLTACADTGQSETVPASEDTNAEESTDVNSDDDTATAKLITEEDYRKAIASASDDDKKLELYTEFSSVYKMTEQEYLEYAALCEKAGDTVSARKALFALYRSDPTEQHGQMLSDMTVRITPADDDKAQGLLAVMMGIADENKGVFPFMNGNGGRNHGHEHLLILRMSGIGMKIRTSVSLKRGPIRKTLMDSLHHHVNNALFLLPGGSLLKRIQIVGTNENSKILEFQFQQFFPELFFL